MVPGIFKITIRSIIFYKKPVLYQVLIIALLAAVITGSLLTGRSVRTSLKRSASEHLGNTGVLITSGIRYFDGSLVERLKDFSKINCTGLLEINGNSQNLASQKIAFNTHIYGVNQDFFVFHGKDSISIKPGEVAVNMRLANYLGLKKGDDLIMRFNDISDIPGDAPFVPAKKSGMSIVMKVGRILEPINAGNFSLSISQIMPMNIFINLSDLKDISGNAVKINRMLIEKNNGFSSKEIYTSLKHVLKLSDVGFSFRMVKSTGEIELISDRVFIDEVIMKEIKIALPSTAPVITYLGNRFKAGKRSTPYSFVSALPSLLYPEIAEENGIIINRWLADDLVVNKGDTIEMFWYSPDSLSKLIEYSNKFIIKQIVDMHGIWSDSLLMPDFPGISGSESCSDWDAGVPIKLDDIRQKDEDYWNKFRGTPKAFISYEKGKELWGNNFGPATALRFPETVSDKEIEEKLKGTLDPDKTGFRVVDLYNDSMKAANESVDFSTLFLSLGFFLILASMVLLSFAVTSYFDSKKNQINAYFALGFNTRWIRKLLFTESGLIALIGCITGSFVGYLVNILITKALNSVWRGAVQTDTLDAYFNLLPVLTGFVATMVMAIIFMTVKINRYLKRINLNAKEIYIGHSKSKNFIFLLISTVVAISLFTCSLLYKDQELFLCLASGTVLLIAQILMWRQFYISSRIRYSGSNRKRKGTAGLYYSYYPSHAVTPILFISAGIFAVFITAANRMNFSEQHLTRSGGTGGYLLWCENTIPIKENLNTLSGKKTLGLDNEQLSAMSFVQAKRSQGDDASCLNLNHVSVPPLLGIDPSDFISKGSFSFAKKIADVIAENPWEFLNITCENHTIYGIADQTVLQWGLKIKPGDTLMVRDENGQPLNIIIAAGLKSSVFQGYILIGMENFTKYYPSVSGSSVLLIDGDSKLVDTYKSALNERLDNFGINTEKTNERLASFYEVTNTYLSVFGVFSALGMITAVAGLGFVLLRNYYHRKREFALMMATGTPIRKIRRTILSEQIQILFAGVTSGVIAAIVATLPSLTNNTDIPWLMLIMMVFLIIATGLTTLIFSVRTVTNDSLTASLKKE